MSKSQLPLVGAVALLASCTVGPDYVRPDDTEVPGTFRGQAQADAQVVAEQETFGDLAWSQAFGDPVLQELIETALVGNHDLLIAAERILQAGSFVTITRADGLPDVSAGASFQTSKISENDGPLPPGLDPESEQWSISGNLSWELDFWGRYARANEAARADLMGTRYARRAVVQGLVTQIVQSYFNLLLLDEQLEITQGTLASRTRSFELVSLRLEQGVANKVEFHQAESLMLETAGTLPALEQGIELEENLLRFLTGGAPGPVPRGLPLREQAFAISVPIGLPSDLLERRPDVAQAEQNLVAANARIGEAKALLYPSIRLTAFGGLASENLSDLTESGSDVWGITPSLLMPIFNAGSLRGNVDVTESRQREAALRYSQTLQNAFREVADALVSREKRSQIRAWRERSDASQSGQVELSRERYRGGVTSYLEVLDSERGHFEAEINLSISIRDELQAYVALYRALGGGWQSLEEAPGADDSSPDEGS